MTTPANPQGGEGNSGGGSGAEHDRNGVQGGGSRRTAAEEFIAANRGATRAVARLLQHNDSLRQRVGTLEQDLEKRPKLAADAVVLTGDDAKAWGAFKALNLAPDDLTKAVAERDEHATWRREREEADRLGTLAGAVGYNARVLADVAKLRGLVIESREVEVDEKGQKVKRAIPHVVTGTGDAAAVTPLTEYAAAHLADYLPALQGGATHGTASTGTAGARSGTAPQGGTTSTTRYPLQRERGAAAAPVNPAEDYLARTSVTPSQRRQHQTAGAGGGATR